MVELNGASVVVAADLLNINYSTAKSIVRLFRITGRIRNKKVCLRKGAFTVSKEEAPCY